MRTIISMNNRRKNKSFNWKEYIENNWEKFCIWLLVEICMGPPTSATVQAQASHLLSQSTCTTVPFTDTDLLSILLRMVCQSLGHQVGPDGSRKALPLYLTLKPLLTYSCPYPSTHREERDTWKKEKEHQVRAGISKKSACLVTLLASRTIPNTVRPNGSCVTVAKSGTVPLQHGHLLFREQHQTNSVPLKIKIS